VLAVRASSISSRAPSAAREQACRMVVGGVILHLRHRDPKNLGANMGEPRKRTSTRRNSRSEQTPHSVAGKRLPPSKKRSRRRWSGKPQAARIVIVTAERKEKDVIGKTPNRESLVSFEQGFTTNNDDSIGFAA
jgi:hypothetical protein